MAHPTRARRGAGASRGRRLTAVEQTLTGRRHGGGQHGHHGGAVHAEAAGWVVLDALVILTVVALATGYAVALWAARDRSPWPARHGVAWYIGLACVAAGLVGPVAVAARSSFTAHMAAHLLVGMVAPLLLVLAAPVTLLVRALPVTGARTVTSLLRSPVVRVGTHPVVAAALNAGGLWALYTTGLYPAMHTSVLIHGLVHAHVLLAGYVFTASVVGVDPNPHRASVAVRSVVLVLFVAAHSVLAKRLYAHPPAGVDADDARVGAQLMYYGGDLVDVTLIVLLFSGWYAAGRTLERGSPGHST